MQNLLQSHFLPYLFSTGKYMNLKWDGREVAELEKCVLYGSEWKRTHRYAAALGPFLYGYDVNGNHSLKSNE